MLDQFKRNAIEIAVKKVMKEALLTELHAIQKMQAIAAKQNNNAILECLIEYKNELIESGRIEIIG